MAWTAPKTWVYKDPLNQTNLNTYIRDNQLDLDSRVNAINARTLLHHAFIQVSGPPSSTALSPSSIGADYILTFTPSSDLVIFTAQFVASLVTLNPSSTTLAMHFGVSKGGSDYSLDYTAPVSAVGNSSNSIAYAELDEALTSNVGNFTLNITLNYSVPVSVVRGTQVSLQPTWWVTDSAAEAELTVDTGMLLMAEEVGDFG